MGITLDRRACGKYRPLKSKENFPASKFSKFFFGAIQ